MYAAPGQRRQYVDHKFSSRLFQEDGPTHEKVWWGRPIELEVLQHDTCISPWTTTEVYTQNFSMIAFMTPVLVDNSLCYVIHYDIRIKRADNLPHMKKKSFRSTLITSALIQSIDPLTEVGLHISYAIYTCLLCFPLHTFNNRLKSAARQLRVLWPLAPVRSLEFNP